MSNPDDEGPQQHPLVEALVPDPSLVPPNATRITGYVGRSSTSGTWRLYLSPNLDRYVEIPEAEILYSQQLPGDRGTAIWVRRDAKLHLVAVQSRDVQADYLSGPITRAAVRAPAAVRPAASPLACGRLTNITHGCTHGGGGIGPCGGGATDLCGDTADGCSTWCEDTTWCTEPSEC